MTAGAGDGFSVALGADGRAFGWGGAFYGELLGETGAQESKLNTKLELKKPRELQLPMRCGFVACGRNHALAASEDGGARDLERRRRRS